MDARPVGAESSAQQALVQYSTLAEITQFVKSMVRQARKRALAPAVGAGLQESRENLKLLAHHKLLPSFNEFFFASALCATVTRLVR